MNNLNFTGRIGKDCETRHTAGGDSVTSFTVAFDAGYGEKKITNWVTCSMWGKRGESVAPYLLKGTQIAVSGEFICREYTDKDGNKRTSNDVRVNDLTLIGSKGDRQEARQEAKPDPVKTPPAGFDDDSDIPF